MPGFLKKLWLAFQYVHMSVCVSVCTSQSTLITSGMVWCDIDQLWLIKQVLRLFRFSVNCFIWHFTSIKWMGMALLNTARCKYLPTRPMWQTTCFHMYISLPKYEVKSDLTIWDYSTTLHPPLTLNPLIHSVTFKIITCWNRLWSKIE